MDHREDAEEVGRELRLPLNSRRLTGATTKRIGRAMDVPTTASAVDVLQMIEAKLTEEGRDPRNVQVLLSGTQPGQEITLEDETGTILEIPQDEETTAEVQGGAGTGTGSVTGSEPGHVEEGALETLRSDLAEAQEQTEALQEEAKQLQDQLGKEKISINHYGKCIVKVLLSLMCMYLKKTMKLKF